MIDSAPSTQDLHSTLPSRHQKQHPTHPTSNTPPTAQSDTQQAATHSLPPLPKDNAELRNRLTQPVSDMRWDRTYIRVHLTPGVVFDGSQSTTEALDVTVVRYAIALGMPPHVFDHIPGGLDHTLLELLGLHPQWWDTSSSVSLRLTDAAYTGDIHLTLTDALEAAIGWLNGYPPYAPTTDPYVGVPKLAAEYTDSHHWDIDEYNSLVITANTDEV